MSATSTLPLVFICIPEMLKTNRKAGRLQASNSEAVGVEEALLLNTAEIQEDAWIQDDSTKTGRELKKFKSEGQSHNT